MSKGIRLFYLINPSHTINALSIIEAFPDSEHDNFLLVHWPGATDKISKEIFNIIETLAGNHPKVKEVVFFPESLKTQIVEQRSVGAVQSSFRKQLGQRNVAEIFYPHDVEGGMFNLLCLVFPFARRICFGDTFGNVVERDVHLGLLIGKPTRRKRFDRWLNRWKMLLHLSYRKEYLPEVLFVHDESRLILPVDQSGRFLKMRPYQVIPKKDFLEAVRYSIASAKGLGSYIDSIIERHGAKQCHLLVTDNLAEGNFIEFDREIEMYAEMVRSSCKPGSVIFIKAHPGETLPRNEAIVKKLGNEYEVVALDVNWKRYPLELWSSLLLRCETVVCISYPTLSLKYLYGIDVTNPMTDSFIEKWFREWTWVSYRDSRDLYVGPLANLKTWDGSSILFSGKAK